MVRSGDISLSDVKRILRRHWWILALTTGVLGFGGLLAALLLPKHFTSQTMILVKQATVPTDIVKPIVTDDLTRRLASMQEQILSRTRLQPIIDKFDLYKKDRAKTSEEELVRRLRSSVKVTPLEAMQGTDSRQLPGFYIDVEFENAKVAQAICAEVSEMFLEQNKKERENDANKTTAFLTGQLQEAKAKLDEQDSRLAGFKRQYLGSLPEEEQTNLSLLTSTNSQLEATTQALSRAEQDRAFNESLLSSQEANGKGKPSAPADDATQLELDRMNQQLVVLLAHYTAKHPDVVKLEGQIEQLKKRQSQEQSTVTSPNDGGAPVSNNPQTQQLRAKVRQDEIDIKDLTKRQAQIQEQIRNLQGRVQESPVVEQQFKEITRDHQTALDFYNDLLKRRETSAMAGDLEQQQESERFTVYDPPNLPEKPSSPNQPLLAGGGLAGGVALGLGILYLIAYGDKTLHNERDVEKCLKLPVLTLIPELRWQADDDMNRQKLAEVG
jgi:polysaccharide chain length determinant protein (PEP-CTERM system associated)